jgi:hypothetical protein
LGLQKVKERGDTQREARASIKVKYEDLAQYLERQRYHPVGEE